MKLHDLLEGVGPAGWKKKFEARIDIEPSYSHAMKNDRAVSFTNDAKKAAYKAAKVKFTELQQAHPDGLLFKTVDEAKDYLAAMEYPNWPVYVQNNKGKIVKVRGDTVSIAGVKELTPDDITITDVGKGRFEVAIPGATTGPLIGIIKTVAYRADRAKKPIFNKRGYKIDLGSYGYDTFKSNSITIEASRSEVEGFLRGAKVDHVKWNRQKDESKEQAIRDEEQRKRDVIARAQAKKERLAALREKYGKFASMVTLKKDPRTYKWSVSLKNSGGSSVVADNLTQEQAERQQEALMIKLKRAYEPDDEALRWCAKLMDNEPEDYLALRLEGGKITSDTRVWISNGDDSEFPHPFGAIKRELSVSKFKNLSTFKNFPESLKELYLYNTTKLTSFKDIHKHIKKLTSLHLNGTTDVKSHILGLLLIDGLASVEYNFGDTNSTKAIDIINKHLGKGRAGVLAAQQELLDAGLDDYAQM